MKLLADLQAVWRDFLGAVQFLTRIPVSFKSYSSDALARSVIFFPFVGLLVGALAGFVFRISVQHVARPVAALLTLICLVLLTGSFHEDGLADAADGLGGGWNQEQVLAIMRDSRIGTYGAVALVLSLLGRFLLLDTLHITQVARYLIAAHVLCRWTTLPLSFFLPAARSQSSELVDGQGARIANLVSGKALAIGTCITLAIVITTLRRQAAFPVLAACLVTLVSGIYFHRRLGGVTGDCLGAANQLAEMAVYLCGVWVA